MSVDGAGARYVFADVEIDRDRYEVRRGGEVVAVEPQVFDVLAYLLDHRDRVVTKDELLDAVWGDRFVSESALTSRIKSVRQAVGDDGRRQSVIRTVHGRGYEFVAPVEVLGSAPPGAADAGAARPEVVSARRPGAAPIASPAKPIVGRADLLAALEQRLEPGSLLTLIGPAGVGKTHLARHAAPAVSARYPAGIWLVPLANIRTDDSVSQAVLDAVGESRLPDQSIEESVLAALRDRAGLLILDNCEHVLDAAARLARDLRSVGGPLSILATSRQRLGVSGERVLDVPVLDAESATQLFADRAEEHGAQIDRTSTDVRDVCGMLDNLPLALELAGAHTRILGLEQLSQLLDDRLELLSSTGLVDSHHETLERAIASSYDALDPPHQQTLCRFSVFAGRFDLDGAKALASIGGDVSEVEAVRHLIELADRSLVTVESDDGAVTYRLLESVRLFAAARLEDRSAAEAAHLDHYKTEAVAREASLWGADFETELVGFADNWDNYRAAVSFALGDGSSERLGEAIELLVATTLYAELAQRFEHADWATSVLASSGDDHPGAAATRAGLARMRAWQSRLDEATALLEGQDVGTDAPETIGLGLASFWVAALNGDHDRALEIYAHLDAATRGTGGLYELVAASIYNRLATNAGIERGDGSERIRAIARTAGPIAEAFALHADVHEALQAGDHERAVPLCEELIKFADSCGLTVLALGAQTSRALAMQHTDDPMEMARSARRGLESYRRRGQWISVPVDGEVAARALTDLGRPEPGRRAARRLPPARLPGPRLGVRRRPRGPPAGGARRGVPDGRRPGRRAGRARAVRRRHRRARRRARPYDRRRSGPPPALMARRRVGRRAPRIRPGPRAIGAG